MKKLRTNLLYLILSFAIGSMLTSCIANDLNEIGTNVDAAKLENGEESNPPKPPVP